MPKFSSPEYAPLPDVVLYTPKELAAFLRCSTQTIYNLIDDGTIKAACVRKGYRIRRSDFECWYQQQFGVLLTAEQARG